MVEKFMRSTNNYQSELRFIYLLNYLLFGTMFYIRQLIILSAQITTNILSYDIDGGTYPYTNNRTFDGGTYPFTNDRTIDAGIL